MNDIPSGQQAVDLGAALRWADRHEAHERQKLRDMGLPPEGDMPVPGAVFVRGLVAMLRTTAPTAPSTAAGELERLEEVRNRLSNHFGYGARLDGSTRDRIAAIDARLAALATPPAPSAPWEEQAARIRNDALEEAAKIADIAADECEPPSNGYLKACQNEAISIAERIRALLSKPAKGGGSE